MLMEKETDRPLKRGSKGQLPQVRVQHYYQIQKIKKLHQHNAIESSGNKSKSQTYFLSGKDDEKTSHLFFNCEYTGTLLLGIIRVLNDSIWKIIPSLTLPDIRIGDITKACQKFTILLHRAYVGMPQGATLGTSGLKGTGDYVNNTTRSPETVLMQIRSTMQFQELQSSSYLI